MPKYTIVQQRHEGAYYPGIALDSLMNFLAQSKGGFSDDISNQVRFPSHKFQGGAGLRILEEAWVAAEEFVLTTWIVHKLPELIPGTVSDRVSRDITTYLVSGRQVEASLDDVKKTSSLGFFTAKRLVFSSKATRSIQGRGDSHFIAFPMFNFVITCFASILFGGRKNKVQRRVPCSPSRAAHRQHLEAICLRRSNQFS